MVSLLRGRVASRGAAIRTLVLTGTAALVLGATPALAEFQVGVYGGWSESFDSDIHLQQPGGTNLTLSDVPWSSESFAPPPYWGMRGTYWLDSAPNWGLMIDYNHAKVIADQGAIVGANGTRDGVKIGPRDRVGNTFQVMEFTDGINEIFFGGQYRWMGERWTPYVGVGVGFAFPHVEVLRRPGQNNPYTYNYQVTGVAVEGLVGIEYHVGPRLSIFGDYKLSYSDNDASLKGGGSLQTDITTNHFILGASWRFGAAPPPPAPY